MIEEEKISCLDMVMLKISLTELKDRGLGFPGDYCLYFWSLQGAVPDYQNDVELEIVWLSPHVKQVFSSEPDVVMCFLFLSLPLHGTSLV